MVRTLNIVGFSITAAYVGLVGWLINERILQLFSMPLNELGDFFAGVFGPLAIFWLVLGFLQQGRELQQSTEALKLQAKELNSSVQQQKELVEVSRKQAEAELEAVRYEREKQLKQASPNFVFHGIGGSHRGDGLSTFGTTVQNTGGTVTHVSVSSDGSMEVSPDTIHSWETNAKHKLEWKYRKGESEDRNLLTISFLDSLGNRGARVYDILVNNEELHPDAKICEKANK